MRKLFIIVLSFVSIAAFGQTNTYSPYSRYGLGELSRQGLAFNKGMGGTGIGLRLPNSINFINPASYTTQDTLSFIFDFGLYSDITTYRTSTASSQDVRTSLDHIVMGFPVTKWWKSSVGLVPYSRMGYNILNEGAALYNYSYQGTGGINKFYVGNAFKIKDLSVGFNFNVLFGSLEQTNSYNNLESTEEFIIPTERFQQQAIRSTSLTLGLQYNIRFSDDINVVLGGIFENKSRLVSDNRLLVTNSFYVIDTMINPYTGNPYGRVDQIDTINNADNKVRSHLPMRYGLGFSLNLKNKIIVAADYSTQKWSEYQSFNPFDSLADTRYLNFGIQYTPDEKSIRNYWKRINFRAGFFANDTYLKLGGQQIKDYGVTMGLRFPFKGNKSAVQLSYEFGKLGTTDHNLVRENYHLINLSISLYDFWFVQSKFD